MKISQIFTKKELYVAAMFITSVIIIGFLVKYQDNLWGVRHLLDLYNDLLIWGAKSLLPNKYIFDFANNSILSGDVKINVDYFFYSFFYILFCFLVIAATPLKTRHKILWFIFIFVVFSVYNILRLSIHVVFPNTIASHHWLFNILMIPKWLIVFGFVYYFWQKYPKLKDYLLEIFNFDEAFYRISYIKLLILVVSYYALIIFFFNEHFSINGSFLVRTILNISKYIIQSIGYEVWLLNRLIYNDKASILMEDSCIGINLMFIYMSFIVLMPGRFLDKFIFIVLGIISIITLNILRIVFIFIVLFNTNNEYTLPIDWHDVFTYPVLIFTFFMWRYWLNKYSLPYLNELDIDKQQNK